MLLGENLKQRRYPCFVFLPEKCFRAEFIHRFPSPMISLVSCHSVLLQRRRQSISERRSSVFGSQCIYLPSCLSSRRKQIGGAEFHVILIHSSVCNSPFVHTNIHVACLCRRIRRVHPALCIYCERSLAGLRF